MSSVSSSFGQSTSVPTVTPTPENSILDQIAGIAVGLGQQMASWAQGAYAKTSQVTDQTVGNFLQASQQMMGLSGKMTDQYNNLFAPENAQLVQDANSYASPSRMGVDMGMAGATQAQAGQAAMRNSEQQLTSFGIDPSSGRYAALDKADQVQNAANVAGAENMQRQADINTGQQLRSEAVQVGSLLPSAISNTTNTAIQANAGASNASLANANTGANLMDLANHYLSTAMALKLSPVGQKSQSTNSSGSSSQQQPQQPKGGGSGGGGAGGGGGGSPFGGGGPAWGMNMPTGGQNLQTFPGAKGGGGGADWSGALNGLPSTDGSMPDFSYLDGYGTGSGSIGDQTTDPFNDYGNGSNMPTDGLPGNDAYGDGSYGGNQDSTNFGDGSAAGNDYGGTGFGDYGSSYDPSANATDPGWDNTYDQPADPSVFDSGSSDSYAGGGTVRPGHPRPMPRPRLPHGNVPFQVNAAGGGQITQQMSPSGGQQTDDVRANLNSDEFVVPKDVAKWKGEEFFHNMIAQSRMKRQKMAASLGTGPRVGPQPQMGGHNGAA